MSRQTRIEYEGAWYHVVNRGAGRQRVFRTDSQRRYFLSLLGETAERFKAEWHAYCLMGNHCHLMVRTPEGNLQRIMRHVNGLYTQYFNRSARRDGTLFRGRYKAVLVDVEAYWLELSRYIHRNPLEAGLVEDLASYRWSSYRAYCGLEKAPGWLTTGFILNARGRRDRHRRYAVFVAEETADALVTFYGKAKLSPILGNDEFRARGLGRRAPRCGGARDEATIRDLNRKVEIEGRSPKAVARDALARLGLIDGGSVETEEPLLIAASPLLGEGGTANATLRSARAASRGATCASTRRRCRLPGSRTARRGSRSSVPTSCSTSRDLLRCATSASRRSPRSGRTSCTWWPAGTDRRASTR
jgi:REP element-mobilizing transposase RayT